MRTYHFYRVIWLFICVGLSVECHDSSIELPLNSFPDDLTKLIPLQLGNSWKYRTITYYNGGCDTTIDSIQIVDTVWMNGRKYYKYSGTPPHFLPQGDFYFEAVDREDYSMYRCMDCLHGVNYTSRTSVNTWLPLHILKTPLIKGHQWRVAEWDTAQGYDFGTLTIINPDTSIQIGDRKFEHAICLSQPWSVGFFIVPGIGVVSQSTGGLDFLTERELIAWNLK